MMSGMARQRDAPHVPTGTSRHRVPRVAVLEIVRYVRIRPKLSVPASR
jgi:L-asparagine transporter-like permease